MHTKNLEYPFSRRQILGGIMLGAGAAQLANSQQACAPHTFKGIAGHTAADSKPSLLDVPHAPSDSPNIIYIVLDDTGFSDLHCFGSEIATPNIDALASGGLLYNNFRTKAVCA